MPHLPKKAIKGGRGAASPAAPVHGIRSHESMCSMVRWFCAAGTGRGFYWVLPGFLKRGRIRQSYHRPHTFPGVYMPTFPGRKPFPQSRLRSSETHVSTHKISTQTLAYSCRSGKVRLRLGRSSPAGFFLSGGLLPLFGDRGSSPIKTQERRDRQGRQLEL